MKERRRVGREKSCELEHQAFVARVQLGGFSCDALDARGISCHHEGKRQDASRDELRQSSHAQVQAFY